MVAILDLDPDPEEFQKRNMAVSRNLETHCKHVKVIQKNSLLAKFVETLNKTDYDS